MKIWALLPIQNQLSLNSACQKQQRNDGVKLTAIHGKLTVMPFAKATSLSWTENELLLVMSDNETDSFGLARRC